MGYKTATTLASVTKSIALGDKSFHNWRWTTRWPTQFPVLNTTKQKTLSGRIATKDWWYCTRRLLAKNLTGLLSSSKRKLDWLAMKSLSLKTSPNSYSLERVGDSSPSVVFWRSANFWTDSHLKCFIRLNTYDITQLLCILPNLTLFTSF